MLLLVIAGTNRYIMVEFLVLQSITSTFSIGVEYVNAWSGKLAMNKVN